jgi:hypothetical protein
MTDVLINDETLRRAMRDPRYWQWSHPDRETYRDWVSRGFQALERSGRNGGRREVQVRAHTRRRNGREERVGSYTQSRGAAAAEGGRSPAGVPETAVSPAEAPARPTLVAFVGGAGDAKSGLVRDFQTTFGGQVPNGRSIYVPHDGRLEILRQIGDVPYGTRIVLIGHSWGGDTAARVAAELGQRGRPVDLLLTVDPVGSAGKATDNPMRADFLRSVSVGAREWTNVEAVGGGTFEGSNILAALGGPYGDGPREFATRHIEANFRHGDFRDLLRAADPEGGNDWLRVMGR